MCVLFVVVAVFVLFVLKLQKKTVLFELHDTQRGRTGKREAIMNRCLFHLFVYKKHKPDKMKESQKNRKIFCRNNRHILNQMYTKHIQALFYVMRRRRRKTKSMKRIAHTYIYIYTYIHIENYTALHCTAHI